MAFVVARPQERWEIRESQATTQGPRARTLVTFSVLTAEKLQRAAARAEQPFDKDEVRAAAHRAGAPVAVRRADLIVGDLLIEIDGDRDPSPALRSLLADALGTSVVPLDDHVRAMRRWVTATPAQRGATLRDLLSLVDALPPRRVPRTRRFPRLDSTGRAG